ncbi:MAG: hypothetical protein LQ338_007118, partial [Usnochroma carphineum]
MDDECANPLWLAWMRGWLEDARLKNLKSATTLKKACDSLKSCPLPMMHPVEAQALSGFGPKTCERLEKQLRQHCEENGLPMPKRKSRNRMSENLEDVALDMTPAKKPRKTTKPYVPQLRSGPYAILLALASISDNECVSKQQLIEMAQPHCDASFAAPKDTTSFHTAWSSMKTLLNKDLVKERRGPQKRYELTDEGWDVAEKIKRVGKGREGSAEGGYGSKNTSLPVGRGEEERPDHEHRRNETTSRFRGPQFLIDEDSDTWPSASNEITRQRPPLADRVDQNVPRRSSPSGQRLGGAVTDKYGTLASSKKDTAKQRDTTASSYPTFRPGNAVSNLQHLEDDSRLAARLQAEEDKRADAVPTDFDFVELLSSPPAVAVPPAQPPRRAITPSIDRPSVPRESNIARASSLRPESTSLHPSSIFIPPLFQPNILSPSTFTIELILDNREIRSREDRTYIETQLLQNHSIRPLIRSLPLGDFFWVAKLKDPTLLSRYGEEGDLVALDYIIERKRLDDLIASIKDGRFREQKFRLRRSGVQNVVYLIEEIGMSQEMKNKYFDAVKTAIASTQVIDNFTVKRTKGLDESIRYLACMTRLMKSIYE